MMTVESNFTLLIILAVLLLFFSILNLVMLIVLCVMVSGVKKNQRMNSVQPDYMAGRTDSVVQRNNVNSSVIPQSGTNTTVNTVKEQVGQIICRKCYAAVPENQKQCPCCQTVIDRRA